MQPLTRMSTRQAKGKFEVKFYFAGARDTNTNIVLTEMIFLTAQVNFSLGRSTTSRSIWPARAPISRVVGAVIKVVQPVVSLFVELNCCAFILVCLCFVIH